MRVARGAVVRDSIVMFDTYIGEGAAVDRSIIDKDCVIGNDARIGDGDDMRPNRIEPERLSAGITLIGKRAFVPWGATIGRNCRIDPGVTEADFKGQHSVPSGETVVHAG